ncbi:hypothetical protein NL676_031936 [Syzygium grande]|nr:hypothetical protein NL676_031936 [Syzygium grande]
MRHPIAPRPTQSRPKPRSSLEIAANDSETEPEAIPLPREVNRARNCEGDGIGREGGLTWKAGMATATVATEPAEPWWRFLGVGDHELYPGAGERDPAIEVRRGISGGRTQSSQEPRIWRSKEGGKATMKFPSRGGFRPSLTSRSGESFRRA